MNHVRCVYRTCQTCQGPMSTAQSFASSQFVVIVLGRRRCLRRFAKVSFACSTLLFFRILRFAVVLCVWSLALRTGHETFRSGLLRTCAPDEAWHTGFGLLWMHWTQGPKHECIQSSPVQLFILRPSGLQSGASHFLLMSRM